ncbi:hypothetical protein CNR22_02815 [Sphingobacteriaceae bacterium]|nr:hypothetical protein CNR22_02815 [Sphingobacteriaceae bacterium]
MIKVGFSISRQAKLLGVKFVFALVFLSTFINAQPPQFKAYNYIEQYSQTAIRQMVLYKIPASVILAQAIFESSSGTSMLAKKSNNHFGIKCHAGWSGDTIVKHDDELNECFRSYATTEDSYKDHSLFLISRPRYAELFKLSVYDYKSWCMGLKNAGYATSPTYAYQLIKLIEELKLYELDGAEILCTEIRRLEKEPEIKFSKYTGKGFSVRDLSRSGCLWLDAEDITARSLDFIVNKEVRSATIAGN